ncbi:MAG: hypothetical protein M1822_010232 [Bathelium mastoideum]|nr:MAG: hypothetical protein M1822_010232 [Bathelium mastoideum]
MDAANQVSSRFESEKKGAIAESTTMVTFVSENHYGGLTSPIDDDEELHDSATSPRSEDAGVLEQVTSIESTTQSQASQQQAVSLDFQSPCFPTSATEAIPSPYQLSDRGFGSTPQSLPPVLGTGVSSINDSALNRLQILPIKNQDEAKYLLYFTNHLSTWLDVCDSGRHFGTEIPRRAMHSPLLLQAIFAWASLHMFSMKCIAEDVASEYYDKALQLLIPILNEPRFALTDEVLATIVILRSYEEYSEIDSGTHLLGSSQLLTSLSHLSTTSHLHKAASWVMLRQDLYFALVHGQPLTMPLYNYVTDMISEQDGNDDAWANRAVVLFAQVLSYCFGEDGQSDEAWNSLTQSIDDWFYLKPSSFNPLWTGLATEHPDSVFPVLYMLLPGHGK